MINNEIIFIVLGGLMFLILVLLVVFAFFFRRILSIFAIIARPNAGSKSIGGDSEHAQSLAEAQQMCKEGEEVRMLVRTSNIDKKHYVISKKV